MNKQTQIFSLIFVIFCLNFPQHITGYSTGADVYACDAKSDIWGCRSGWNNDDRLDCADSDRDSRFMTWATSPVTSSAYSIVVGDLDSPATQYYPGEYIDVNVVVNEFGKEFRGVLLYAKSVDSGEKVGEWETPDGRYVGTTLCPNSVMHVSAEIKPYRSRFQFKAPDAGVGSIRFEALIKRGDANHGDFFRPSDVVVTEAQTRTRTWYTSLQGQSCSGFCTSIGLGCDPDASIESAQDLDEILRYQVCTLPLISGCYESGSGTGSEGLCYYHDNTCSAQGRSVYTPDCSSASTSPEYGMRFCACVEGGVTGDTTPLNTETESTESESFRNSLSFITLLFAMFFWRDRSGKVLIITLIAITMIQGSYAHNWINTPSRSGGASTVSPCPSTVSTDPHVQVGPDQEFAIEWMVGHKSRRTYFVVVHESNYDKLILHNETILEDYLANAPSNLATESAWMKYHRKPDTDLSEGHFKSLVSSSVIPRPDASTAQVDGEGHLFDYFPDELSNDARASYVSEKYPWIESVHRFHHIAHLPFRRFDTANFTIPGRQGTGRYIVHYIFGGYRDCIDVDLMTEKVEHVYGVASAEDSWAKIDHCFFEDPREIMTPCNEAFVGAQDPGWCKTVCSGLGRCHGLNVVPLVDKYSKFNDVSLIPWNDPVCADSASIASFDSAPEDTYVCYGVRARLETDTLGTYVTTSDPDHPYFYSTCYIKKQARVFLDSPSVTPEIPPWRFNDRCLSCDDYKTVSEISPIFDYPFADVCVDCDIEPGDEAKPAANMVAVMNASACDGYSGGYNARLESSGHLDQSTCTTYDCFKKLTPLGLNVDIGENEDCEFLARRDPECSNHVYIEQGKYRAGCYCYKNLDCCKTCSGVVGYRNGNYFYSSMRLFEIDPPSADPTCSTGTLSENGEHCCPGTCSDCSLGLNAEPGFCSYAYQFMRSCSEYGPPCNMD